MELHHSLIWEGTKLTVTDRVFATRDIGNIPKNTQGVIAIIDSNAVGVVWDIKFDGGHDLGGLCEYGYGWWVNADDLNLVFEYDDKDYDMTPATDEELDRLFDFYKKEMSLL